MNDAYIKGLYLKVYHKAVEIGLPIDNICIYLRNDIKHMLGLGNTLIISYETFTHNVSVIGTDDIPEEEKDGDFQSNIYIYDPDWAEIE